MSLYLGYVQSLFRRGGSFGPRPTLDLNFMGGSIGSQVTFSRGTKAMRYDSDGTLQYGPHNLLLHSEDFTNALWLKGQAGVGFVPTVTANQGIAPNGTLTADRVDFNCVGNTNTDRSLMYQAVTSTSGTPYASSYYIKAFDLASVGKTIRYTVETGASSNQVIITLTSEWQRVSNIFPAAGAGYNAILETRGTVTSSTNASVLLWGAQVSEGSIPGEYQATTTAAVYGPRFDYDPSSLVAQNLLLQSQNFSDVNWTKQTGTTVTGVKAFAPNGTLTADQINWASTATGQGIFQPGASVSKTTNNTKSIYVRADVAGGTVELADPNGTTGTPAFTLSTSWQRISLTETQPAGSAGLWLRKTASSPTTIYVWGSQLNNGSTALPYTETTTAPYTLCALRGLLIEEQRTNGIRNNRAQGAVAGSPGTFPTNWLGYLNGITGVAFSIIGTGIEKGINYVDIRMNGTPSATVPQGLQITFDTNNAIAASASQTWTESLWFSIVGGSATNITGFRINTQQYNLGAYVTENNVSFTPTSTLTRYSGTTTFTAATTTHALPLIGLGVTAAAPVDITIRIGLPQLELGSFVTSVIPTNLAAATRNFDNADITSISSWFNASEGTLYGQTIFDHLLPLSGSGAFPGIFHIADGTVNNRIVLTAYNPSATNNHYGTVITAGVDQGSLGTNAFAPNTLVKGAFAYKANDTAYCANNSAAVTDNTVTLPTGLNIANLGGTLSVGANKLNGWLQRVKYYPTRLSNAVLQRITV